MFYTYLFTFLLFKIKIYISNIDANLNSLTPRPSADQVDSHYLNHLKCTNSIFEFFMCFFVILYQNWLYKKNLCRENILTKKIFKFLVHKFYILDCNLLSPNSPRCLRTFHYIWKYTYAHLKNKLSYSKLTRLLDKQILIEHEQLSSWFFDSFYSLTYKYSKLKRKKKKHNYETSCDLH